MPPINPKQFYIFGIQRSGTNFLENIMSKNFSSNRMNGKTKCWKHSIDIPDGYNKNITTIVIHKNPYMWLESIAYRNNVDWIKTQKKYPALDIENKFHVIGEKKKLNALNLSRTYKHFHDTWLPRAHFIIKYEDLLIPEKRNEIIDRIHTELEFPKTMGARKGWIVPNKGQVSQSKDYDDERERYYIAGKPKHLNDRVLYAATEIITPELIRKMGYDVIGPR